MYASSPKPGPATRTSASSPADWSTNHYDCTHPQPSTHRTSCVPLGVFLLRESPPLDVIPRATLTRKLLSVRPLRRLSGGKGSWREPAKSPTHKQDIAARVEAQMASSQMLLMSSHVPAFGEDRMGGTAPVLSATRTHVISRGVELKTPAPHVPCLNPASRPSILPLLRVQAAGVRSSASPPSGVAGVPNSHWTLSTEKPH